MSIKKSRRNRKKFRTGKKSRNKDGKSSKDVAREDGPPPSSPKNESFFYVDLILYNQICVDENDMNIENTAFDTMEEALRTASLERFEEKPVWGNAAGKGLLERLDKLENDQKSNTRQITHLANDLKSNTQQITHLANDQKSVREDITQLQLFSNDYLKVRGRRVDVYRRDVRQDIDEQGLRRIKDVNDIVQDGNAEVDAYLYTEGYRQDENVLIDLYGVNAQLITILRKNKRFDSIRVLNGWSTRVSQQGRSVPAPVKNAFDSFVAALKKDLLGDPLNQSTQLGRMYSNFWDVNEKFRY